MAKTKKKQPLAVNQHEHSLSKHTIVTDRNSFVRKGNRYTISGNKAINILTKKVIVLPDHVKAEVEEEMFNHGK
jgi:hypothetical protein